MEIELFQKYAKLKEIKVLAKEKAEYDVSIMATDELLVAIKKMETFIENYKEIVKESHIVNSDKISDVNGFSIKIGQTSRNDYSNDSEWVKLNNLIKERETLLKSITTPIDVFDELTGEIKRIHPPVKKYSETITITEKK